LEGGDIDKVEGRMIDAGGGERERKGAELRHNWLLQIAWEQRKMPGHKQWKCTTFHLKKKRKNQAYITTIEYNNQRMMGDLSYRDKGDGYQAYFRYTTLALMLRSYGKRSTWKGLLQPSNDDDEKRFAKM